MSKFHPDQYQCSGNGFTPKFRRVTGAPIEPRLVFCLHLFALHVVHEFIPRVMYHSYVISCVVRYSGAIRKKKKTHQAHQSPPPIPLQTLAPPRLSWSSNPMEFKTRLSISMATKDSSSTHGTIWGFNAWNQGRHIMPRQTGPWSTYGKASTGRQSWRSANN